MKNVIKLKRRGRGKKSRVTSLKGRHVLTICHSDTFITLIRRRNGEICKIVGDMICGTKVSIPSGGGG